MNVFFIRHGETIGDVENRYGGAYDDHLTDKGVTQSRALAQQLKDVHIEAIYSSTLLRAKETAQILAEQFQLEPIFVPELQERNQYSFLSGMMKEEALRRYPTEVELLKDRRNTIEGAESYDDFSNRIQRVFEGIADSHEHSTVAIVSHGGPLRVLFRDILQWGELKEVSECAYVELELRDSTFTWVGAGGLIPDFSIPTRGS